MGQYAKDLSEGRNDELNEIFKSSWQPRSHYVEGLISEKTPMTNKRGYMRASTLCRMVEALILKKQIETNLEEHELVHSDCPGCI